MTAKFKNYVIFMIFIVVYLISDLEKTAFHESRNPKNPNLNLDCTDYGDICL